jgi:hypothetical protein
MNMNRENALSSFKERTSKIRNHQEFRPPDEGSLLDFDPASFTFKES